MKLSRLLDPDILGGSIVILLGLMCWSAVGDLAFGQVSRMGPGFMPTVLAILLVMLGIVVLAKGLMTGPAPMFPLMWRPIAAVSAAIFLFGFFIDWLGILVAVAAMTAAASLGSSITRPKEVPWLCLFLAVGAALVFVTGLSLPIPIFPR